MEVRVGTTLLIEVSIGEVVGGTTMHSGVGHLGGPSCVIWSLKLKT